MVLYLSELSVKKDRAEACHSLLLPCALGCMFLISRQLRGPFTSRDGKGWVPTCGHLRSRSPLQKQTGQLPLCYTRSPELLAVKGGAGLAAVPHLIFPIHTRFVPCLDGSVQWADICPLPVVESAQLWALVFWDLEFRTTWSLTQLGLCCNKCLLSRDLPLLPNGSDYPNTCPKWGGGLLYHLGLLANKSLGLAGWRCSTTWRECQRSIHLLLRALLSWSSCNLNSVSWLVRNEILAVLSQQDHSWTNVCCAMWKRQALDHWMKLNIPSHMRSVSLKAYLSWCNMYCVDRLLQH